MKSIQDIFSRQWSLMEKYGPIRGEILGKECQLPLRMVDFPEGLDNRQGQLHFREIVSYITEELWELNVASGEDFIDECVDVLHFIVELCLYSGMNTWAIQNLLWGEVIPGGEQGIVDHCYYPDDSQDQRVLVGKMTLALGATTYHLNGKPWKKNPRKVDEPKFYCCLLGALRQYLQFLAVYFTWDEVYDAYMLKAEENNQRQRENY